jgi:hypothetical protein
VAQNSIRNLVQVRLIEVLTAVQSGAGRSTPNISEETVPLDHLEGFDSLSGVEAAVLLSEAIEIEIDRLPLVAPATGKSLTLKEIVDALIKEYGSRIHSQDTTVTAGAAEFPKPRLA